MYFEEAEVKKYSSTNKATGKERINFQINLKKDSKFREPKTIGLIDITELENIESFLEANNVEEKEAELKQLKEENLQLKEELNKYKTAADGLAADVHKLKEEKLQLQEDLLNAENKSEEIIQLLKEHKEEIAEKDSDIAELNFKLNNEKDYSKALLVVRSDFLKQNALKRLFKVEPESSKIIGNMIKELPEEVEVESKTSEE